MVNILRISDFFNASCVLNSSNIFPKSLFSFWRLRVFRLIVIAFIFAVNWRLRWWFFFWSERRSNKVSYITRSIRLCVSNLIWRVSCIASGIPILIHTIPLIFSEWPHYHINVSCPTICPYTPIIKLENKVFSVSKSCFTKTNGKQRDITKPRQINVLFHEI